MNEKLFKSIVSIGLFVVICICGFIVFHEKKGSAAERNVSEISVTENSDTELINMFEVGLNSKGREEVDPEYYYGMVEAAIQQSSQYPNLIPKFWETFEKHLKGISSSQITSLARIELIDLFDEQVELCANHCKNIEQYNNYWKTRKNISTYKRDVIRNEIKESLKLLEEAKKSDSNNIVRVLKKESNNKESLNLIIAYNFLSDYSSEMTDEQQQMFNEIVQNAGSVILGEVNGKYNDLKNRFIEIKKKCQEDAIEPNIINEDGNEIEYGIGESYQLLLDIQTFVTTELNMELLQTIPNIKSEDIIQLQNNVSDLLEKTRILNQKVYNLWANNVIFNSDDGVNEISKISEEFLYPAVSAYYNARINELREKHPNSSKITLDLYELILKNKAPLSAF